MAPAPRRPRAASIGPIASVGTSAAIRKTGSHTAVPACASACMSTSGVSLFMSRVVGIGPRRDGGPSARLYAIFVTVTTQSVTCQP